MESDDPCWVCDGSGKHPYPPWSLLDWPCMACRLAGRTPQQWRCAYAQAAANLVLMEDEFEPGTPLTPRCEAELDDGGRCQKGRGHDSPCGRIDP